MKLNYRVSVAVAAALLAASAAWAGDTTPSLDQHKLDAVTVGLSTKSQVRSLLGTPWRIVQFNDCGMAMPGQEDETWEYRGSDGKGTFRLHVEFDDNGVARLVARIPDSVPGGKGTAARAVPPTMMAHNHM